MMCNMQFRHSFLPNQEATRSKLLHNINYIHIQPTNIQTSKSTTFSSNPNINYKKYSSIFSNSNCTLAKISDNMKSKHTQLCQLCQDTEPRCKPQKNQLQMLLHRRAEVYDLTELIDRVQVNSFTCD